MEPTIGRIVVFHTTQAQQKAMEASHAFNRGCNVAKELPAIIVAVWGPDTVNLKVFVDGGIGDLWVTSAHYGNTEGEWSWPEIKK
jgi:hypothetical protein